MDTETSDIDERIRTNLEKILMQQSAPGMELDVAEAQHGMPWKSSIDKAAFQGEELLYMPFWEWQMKFMKENLTNLRVVPCTNGETDFTYNENTGKKARIVNLCLTSDEYRKIRLTYYDAGENTQVFNSVWYPDPQYNLPVLGVDLLAFNRKKYLAIVDFQPLHENEDDHAVEYEHLLRPIKESYDNLSGRMSSKFYDETQFFSQQMLFSRFEDESVIDQELFPAFQQYVQTHLDLIKSTQEDEPCANPDFVMERQKAYDTYSAERDPAMGLFMAMFGADWAQDYVHDFLFSMSERPAKGAAPTMPSFMGGGGGGPPPQGGSPSEGGAPNRRVQKQVASSQARR
jgi:15,16-dihydrobiliverdin:ferredoxin oxidoreductase